MREVKFRAWDRARQIMADVTYINFEANIVGYAYRDGSAVISSEEIELMEYTGLKDMNGVDIYECDVVRFDTNVQILESEVTYYHGMFTIKKYGEKIPLFTALKVIGNKFENPELLEVAE